MNDDILGVVTKAIKSEIAHPSGSMRRLPESEEELALAILNALDEAGYEVVARESELKA